ncbi:outer membrane protein assembly factor BamB/predicted Ser/Thr protein kinase [Streptomyces sp. SAI-208]|uniref:serine/threonine-protein kinase n=1 Tax=Streptomyces sp. SAI-208 TaxID=2940550 RepID=UPI002472F3BF|nr:serine/threonine-protein kinase [Streptomyces sp. SAI-208]MDH6610582.1 outer membrane protein assembly factor BamB/predicted Ser/Thr protein kinase [Streptomyces sp. SAI-208]
MPLHKDDPKSVGGYKLVDRLGSGGMGIVYRGRSRSGREVAVKVVHAQYAEDPVFRTRFRQEIEAVRKVSGAFTAPVVDADPDAARPWMATQYVPGRSLADRISELGPLRETELRRLALGLVEALRDIHRAGVVHRDLKPANVLMAGDGPRVIDFGISRAAENNPLTETGQMIGTPPFMSPEQLTDARTVGPPSDIFALGALLVYTLTGRGPFDADSPYLTAYQVVHDEPVLDGVGEELRAVLKRCLAKEAADRPGLDEVAREFARVLPEEAAEGPPTVTSRGEPADPSDTGAPGPEPATSPGRRHRLRPLWAVTAAIGVLAVALTAYLLSGPGRTDSDGGGGTVQAEGAAARGTELPTGWQPWRTTVYASAEHGPKKGITLLDGDDGPECQTYEGAVYCAGDAVMPVRIDGATGRVDWRTEGTPSLPMKRSHFFWLLGVADDVMLVKQQYQPEGGDLVTSVVALDTGTGKQLWHRTVDLESTHVFVSGDLVLVPDIGRGSLTARAVRTGAQRWTAPLPAGMQCDPAHTNVGLYLECVPGMTAAKEILLLGFDRSDGSVRRLKVPPHSTLVGTYDGRLLYLEAAEEVPGHLSTSTKGPFARIRLVDPDTGAATTTELAKDFEGTATTADGTLWFTGTSGRVTAVSVRTGKQLWQTPTGLEQPGGVTPAPGARVVHLSSAGGRVATLDADKGTLLWETLPRAKWVNSQSELPPQVLLDKGALIVTTPSGDVFTLDPAHPERTSASG